MTEEGCCHGKLILELVYRGILPHSGRGEGDGGVHRHHSGGTAGQETLQFVFVSCGHEHIQGHQDQWPTSLKTLHH
ncbi:hypothetical protein JZ751_013466 [Albula glossodonta]|uniref:Uncharacterized protein n=1 Tax=Albula glossodonta TaxID=121402 RepID=A0A8T2N624_9TELE|nr:hypothetical protein JZ751_013466 [Albula glossodonta]